MRNYTTAIGALVAFGIGWPAVPAYAVPEHDHYHYSASQVVDGFCGDLTVRDEVEVDGFFSAVSRGEDGLTYSADGVHGRRTITNLANDKWMKLSFAFHVKDLQVTDNGDGTLTVLMQDAGSLRITASDGQRLMVAGNARFGIVFDHAGTPSDPADDVFLEDLGEFKLTGRQDPHGPTLCDDVTKFIG